MKSLYMMLISEMKATKMFRSDRRDKAKLQVIGLSFAGDFLP